MAVAHEPRSEGDHRVNLAIEGMTCSGCAGQVERALSAVPGVTLARVNLAAERAEVVSDAALAVDKLVAAVEATGYHAHLDAAAEVEDARRHAQWRREGWLMLAMAAFAIPLVLPMLAAPFGGDLMLPPAFQAALAAIVQLIGGARFYRAAWRAVLAASANMDLLVSLGTSAAFLLSIYNWLGDTGGALYFEAAAVVITLVLFGKWLEGGAKRRATRTLRQLLALRPATARLDDVGGPRDVAVDEVRVGDRVLVKPGERIPVDGRILDGQSEIDEALISGESMPVARGPGDRVVVGAVNGGGLLRVEAEAVGADTSLAKIIGLVDRAQAGKAGVQRLVDRVTAVFVPVVLGLAALTAVGWGVAGGGLEVALINAVTVLVIACPCALGLATPAAIVVGTGVAARHGILVKSVEALEAARAIDTVVFDKTGTLTTGAPTVVAIDVAAGADAAEVLRVAASLQSGSEHPLAAAMVAAAAARGLALARPDDLMADPGRGVRGRVAGRAVAVGNRDLLTVLEITPPTDLLDVWQAHDAAGHTAVWVVIEGAVRAVIAIADTPRPTARAGLAALAARGVETLMLSGDSPRVAAAIGADLGLATSRGAMSPTDKAAHLAALKTTGHHIAMVGDGINDAPALAHADLGIALASGTDIAAATADVTLMRGDLRLVGAVLELAGRVRRTIVENLFWAFLFNVIGMPLAAFGYLSPEFAGAAMALSSVMVIGNALRLGRWRPAADIGDIDGGRRITG